ncbi:Bardet-Biedl syndrome 12 protein [Pungitius pungitius]|uniref:Bardet-Biedl syndrome 12 protein n=1 Tax=Pungitius pungitius TaxID=134920 RepID=UPI002E15A104
MRSLESLVQRQLDSGNRKLYCKTLIKATQAMLASTIINHRQHVGLQKLSALAGITHSSLGPNKMYKFIRDETSGESALACSCFRLLENLELTCGVAQLVYETVRAHHKVYGTGSGCLLFLAGAWSRAATECLQRGVPVARIVSAMSEGMDVCLDVCGKCGVSTASLGAAPAESCAATSLGSGLHPLTKPTAEASQASCHLRGTRQAADKTLNASGQRKIKLSRHFYETKTEDVSTVMQPPRAKPADVALVAAGLSHGCDEAMNLVFAASRLQSKTKRQDVSCSTFDVSKVATCVLPGLPEEHACVLRGCVVLVSDEQASVAHHLKEQHLKVALINGDLSDTYRHLGFKRLKGVQSVGDRSHFSSSNKEEEWTEKVSRLLLNLEVKLIVVSGTAGEKVIQRCCRLHILVVEKANVSVLKALADASGAVPVTYATQLSKRCVGSGVKVAIWGDSRQTKPSTAVNISTAEESGGLVTAVLTSCVQSKLQALEDQFWACAYRLHHALTDSVLLPGAGATEMLCVHHLRGQAEQRHGAGTSGGGVQRTRAGRAGDPYRGLVMSLMAEGLIDYVSTVMVNTGGVSKVRARTAVGQRLKDSTEDQGVQAKLSQLSFAGEQEDGSLRSSDAPAAQVYDVVSVKQEAWRRALDLVLLVLQTDAEIITGVGPKHDAAHGDMMLL